MLLFIPLLLLQSYYKAVCLSSTILPPPTHPALLCTLPPRAHIFVLGTAVTNNNTTAHGPAACRHLVGHAQIMCRPAVINNNEHTQKHTRETPSLIRNAAAILPVLGPRVLPWNPWPPRRRWAPARVALISFHSLPRNKVPHTLRHEDTHRHSRHDTRCTHINQAQNPGVLGISHPPSPQAPRRLCPGYHSLVRHRLLHLGISLLDLRLAIAYRL